MCLIVFLWAIYPIIEVLSTVCKICATNQCFRKYYSPSGGSPMERQISPFHNTAKTVPQIIHGPYLWAWRSLLSYYRLKYQPLAQSQLLEKLIQLRCSCHIRTIICLIRVQISCQKCCKGIKKFPCQEKHGNTRMIQAKSEIGKGLFRRETEAFWPFRELPSPYPRVMFLFVVISADGGQYMIIVLKRTCCTISSQISEPSANLPAPICHK